MSEKLKFVVLRRKKDSGDLTKQIKENVVKNIDRIIERLTDADIPDTIQDYSGIPNCMHRMFNTIMFSLVSMMWTFVPEKREYYLKLRTDVHFMAKISPKQFAEMWKKSVEGKEVLLQRNDDTYIVPDFTVLESLELQENWDKLPLDKKVEFWNKLRQLQTISDIMDILPEEILGSLENVAYGAMSISGGTVVDKLTESIIQNDMMLYGIKKLANRLSFILRARLPTPPSYKNLLEKAENY